jgi:hypothetical protein
MKNRSSADPENAPTEFLRGPIEMWLVNAIPFGHHSNGQNGCLFRGQARIDGECEPPPPATVTESDVNTENGSFSTNYIRVALEYRRLYPNGDDPIDLRAITRREWGVSGSVEFNPTGYVGGSIDETLRPLYGPTRFGMSGDVVAGNFRIPIWPSKRLNCGRAWAEGGVMFISGGAPSVENVVTIETACLPAGWGGTGLFVRYYRGQDYYNAAFLQNISRLQFGLTFLQSRFLAFPKS